MTCAYYSITYFDKVMLARGAFIRNAFAQTTIFQRKCFPEFLDTGINYFQAECIVQSHQIKIKSSLYSLHCADACNEWWGPSPRLSALATQLRRNVAAVASVGDSVSI